MARKLCLQLKHFVYSYFLCLLLITGFEACLTKFENGDSLINKDNKIHNSSDSAEKQRMESNKENEWEYPLPHQLKAWKLKNYDVNIPPTFIQGDPTVVKIDIDIGDFMVDELNSMIYINSRVNLEWTDIRLALPESSIDNRQIKFRDLMYFSESEIWWPEITIEDGTNQILTDPLNNLLSVDHLGKVRWRFPIRLASKCQVDNRRWPFDFQLCHLNVTMGTFTNGNMLDLRLLAAASSKTVDTISYKHFKRNSDWDIYKYSTERRIIYCKECTEPQIQVTFSFPIVRNANYSPSVICSTAAIIAVNLAMLVVPSFPMKMVGIAFFNFFCSCVMFIYIFTLPTTFSLDSPHYPLILQLFATNLLWTTLALAIYILVNFTAIGNHSLRWLIRLL